MVGFSRKKKKKDKKEDVLSGTGKKSSKKKEKKKDKKKKKKKQQAEETATMNHHRQEEDEESKVIVEEGIELALGMDSIEQHRDEFEDSIEKHRNEFEDGQIWKLQDWYEQESLAMDLESLKRKPWYHQEENQKGSSGGDEEAVLKKDPRFVPKAPEKHAAIAPPRLEPTNKKKRSEEDTIATRPTESEDDDDNDTTTHEHEHGQEEEDIPGSPDHEQIEEPPRVERKELDFNKFVPIAELPARGISALVEEKKSPQTRKVPIIPVGYRTKDASGQEYEFVPVGSVRANEVYQRREEAILLDPATTPVRTPDDKPATCPTKPRRETVTRKTYAEPPNGLKLQQQVEEFDLVQHNGIPIGFRTRQVIEDEVERLDYARQSIARLQRIEELRKSRELLKIELEEKRKRRKERYERVRRSKRVERETRRTQRERERSRRHTEPEPESFLQSRLHQYRYGHKQATESDPIVLVDLTDVCDRRLVDGTAQRKPVDAPSQEADSWASSYNNNNKSKKEIPVIVDLTNRRKPQQILDLTKMDEPSVVELPGIVKNTPIVVPKESRSSSGHRGRSRSRNSKAPNPNGNRRLDDLRREREEKLYDMTHKFEKVKTKDLCAIRLEQRDSGPSTYQQMMERVTQTVQNSVCG